MQRSRGIRGISEAQHSEAYVELSEDLFDIGVLVGLDAF